MNDKQSERVRKADERREEVEKVSVRHRGKQGVRFFHQLDGTRVHLNPGEKVDDVEVNGVEYDRLCKQSADGVGDLEVSGQESDKYGDDRDEVIRLQDGTEVKQLSRDELNKLERENREKALASAKEDERTVPDLSHTSVAGMGPADRAHLSARAPLPARGSKSSSSDQPERYSRGDLEGMTNDDLRSLAESHGAEVKSNATKAELVDGVVAAQRSRKK